MIRTWVLYLVPNTGSRGNSETLSRDVYTAPNYEYLVWKGGPGITPCDAKGRDMGMNQNDLNWKGSLNGLAAL